MTGPPPCGNLTKLTPHTATRNACLVPDSISIAGYQPPGSLLSQTLRLFVDSINKQLSDELSINITNNIMDLGYAPGEMTYLITSGKYDLGYLATSYFSKAIPHLYIFDLPFTIRNRARAYKLVDGPFSTKIASQIEDKMNLKVLAMWEYGYRHFTNDRHPIRTPEDCQNLAIRTLLNELHPVMFRALGFEPKSMQVSEFLTQLKAGKRFAQENALTNYYHFGLHKFHHHITMSGHLLGMPMFICNKETFEGWPEELQMFVEMAANCTTLKQRELAALEEENVLKALSPDDYHIHTLTEEERSLFETALTVATKPYREIIGKTILEMATD